MPDIFLIIQDAALRDAVLEQIKTAKIGPAQPVDQPQVWLKQQKLKNDDIILIDNPAADKKTVGFIQNLNELAEKPVILFLGAAEENDGATETFAKPFRLGHLIGRLRYYLETAPLLRERTVTFGPYRLEPKNRRILGADPAEPIRLTEKETALLIFLGQSEKPVTRQDILAEVWGYDERIDTHTLETHIYQLRRKLDSKEEWLINEAGAYRLAREKERGQEI